MKIKRIGGGKTRAYSDLTTRPSQLKTIATPTVNKQPPTVNKQPPTVNKQPPEPMKVKGTGRGGRRLRTRRVLTQAEKDEKDRKYAEHKKKVKAMFGRFQAAEDARVDGVRAARQKKRAARQQAERDRAAAASAERQKKKQEEARAAEMRAAAAKPRPKPAEYEPPTPAPDYTSGMIVGF